MGPWDIAAGELIARGRVIDRERPAQRHRGVRAADTDVQELSWTGALSKLHFASLYYLALVLLVLGLLSNLLAQWISHRFSLERALTR